MSLNNNSQKSKKRRRWSDEDTFKFCDLYSFTTFEEMQSIFINLTKSQYASMRRKYKLKKSYEFQKQKSLNAIKKTNNYFGEDKLDYLNSLICKYTIKDVVDIFIQKYPTHSRNFIINKLIEIGVIDSDVICEYRRPKGMCLNLKNAFKLYKKSINNQLNYNLAFSSQCTIILFKWWMRKNNIPLELSYFLNRNEFKKFFQSAKIEQSIRRNFKYTGDFIKALFPGINIEYWHLKIPVPNQYWNKWENVERMINDGFNNLIKDNIIKNKTDIFKLHTDIINEYFNLLAMRLYGTKNIFILYFTKNNIDIKNYTTQHYNNIRFDSLEEMLVYKNIFEMRIKIIKCNIKNKFTDGEFAYIPDFLIYINNKEYVVEYFGLYRENVGNSRILKQYKDKHDNKIKFFNNFNFISIYPKDIKDGFIRINKLLQELMGGE